MTESFFATLKRERIDRVRWRTRDGARTAIFAADFVKSRGAKPVVAEGA